MLRNLDRLAVTSTIQPVDGPRQNSLVVLRGRARATDASVRYVEVSTDGGESWHEATITGANEPSCWVEWEHPWTPRRRGAHTLVSRATDSLGRRQSEHAEDGAVRHRVVVG